METENKIALTTLNELIAINYSRIDGYKKAASDVDFVDLQNLFNGMINESGDFAASLSKYVVDFGGEPTSESTFLGKIHKVWIDFKAAIISNNRQTILSSCEFGDMAAIKAYNAALEVVEIMKNSTLYELLKVQKSIIHDTLGIIRSLLNSHNDTSAEKEVLENQSTEE
jgi:uncharacterized protein (TIGR02284 family)